MDIEFDPVKDVANIAKHGVSLARAVELEILAWEWDARFTHETRFRAWGLLDGDRYCLAFTVRDGAIRALSLRRAHLKEHRRHAH